MRRRLLLVLSVLSLAAVAGFALPLLGSTAAERTQQFVLSRTADLDRFAAFAQRATDAEAIEVLSGEVRAHTQLYGEGVLVVDGIGRTVVSSGLRSGDAGVAAAVDAALRNQPPPLPARLWPWSTDPVLLGRPVGTGTFVGGAIVLRASPAAAAADIGTAWSVVLAGAVAAAVAFAALALLVARWILRPVRELAGGVGAVTAGHPGAHVSPLGGPPELRELAGAFNRMSDAVAASAEQQRRLVADTSHQLRNPLAALRLRIDILERHVEEPGVQTYESTQTEIDRLEALLDGLLDLATAESRATDIAARGNGRPAADPAAVVAEQAALWAPVAARTGVDLQVAGGPATTAAMPADELAQVLDVLIDNAVKYGGSGANVTLAWAPAAGRVLLTVTDDGPGLPPDELAQATRRFWRSPRASGSPGSGLGLAIAAQLVETRGGSLTLTPTPTGGLTATLDLPCSR